MTFRDPCDEEMDFLIAVAALNKITTTTKEETMIARLYVVQDSILETKHLVKAESPASAVSHLTRNQYMVAPAKPLDVVALMGAGVPMQDATKQEDDQTVGAELVDTEF